MHIKLDKSVSTDDPDAGEILFKGNNLMGGYWKKPEENETVFTSDGFFRTGDVGKFDDEGFLYIIGRIKEQYKLTNGKYVVPTVMEEKFKRSLLIDNVSVIGENQRYSVAIISLNKAETFAAAKKNGIKIESIDESDLMSNKELVSMIDKELLQMQAGFKEYEKIRNFYLTFDEWTPDNNILTQSMKVKRREVNRRYADKIEAMYL
ncbi:MAG: AMP-binding protein [Oligoflexales bacterium]|nr:AMP-binding protein [Oligoflexales bacterium]